MQINDLWFYAGIVPTRQQSAFVYVFDLAVLSVIYKVMLCPHEECFNSIPQLLMLQVKV